MFLAADANAGTLLVFIALLIVVAGLIFDRPVSTAFRPWLWLCLAVLLIAIALLVGVNAVVD